MIKPPKTDNPKLARQRRLFLGSAVLQISCGLIFASDVVVEIGHFSSHSWLELIGVVALTFGATVTFNQYRHLLHRNSKIERELDAASGAFHAVLEQHFCDWGLTDAEKDVALLSIKGVPTSEIAIMRQTKIGTIKAQNAAIYRKSGVSSRAELISVMVEELIEGLNPNLQSAGQRPESLTQDQVFMKA